MKPSAPWRGYRAGTISHCRDENNTVPTEFEVPLLAKFSSPVPWHRFPGEAFGG